MRYRPPSSWRSSWPIKSIDGGAGSFWWYDLGRLEGESSLKEGWLSNGITRKMGNKESISFWHDCRATTIPLASVFSRLYLISLTKEACVAQMGESRDGSRSWKLPWRMILYVWEERLLESLMVILEEKTLLANAGDLWCWLQNSEPGYTAKVAYSQII